jgi:hypothetical protein
MSDGVKALTPILPKFGPPKSVPPPEPPLPPGLWAAIVAEKPPPNEAV